MSPSDRRSLGASIVVVAVMLLAGCTSSDTSGDESLSANTTTTGATTETSAAVAFDLTSSAGDIILDTTSGGEGVEVYQDFQVEDGEAVLAVEPVAEDGGSTLRLEFDSFNPGENFTFSIDVDDRLADSDLGQIQVTGAEIEGANIVVETAAGTTLTAAFDSESTARYASDC